MITEVVKPTKGYCVECHSIFYFWDETRQKVRVKYKNGHYLWLNPGQVYEIRCGNCNLLQEIVT